MLPKKFSPKKSNHGFTLIEILIVVAIIAILTAIAATAYTTAQRRARDTQRKSDLASVQAALESFNSDHNYYPTDDENAHIGPYCGATQVSMAWGQPFTDACLTSKIYLGQLPVDPVDSRYYHYTSWTNNAFTTQDESTDCKASVNPGHCQSYIIWAHLESPSTLDPVCVAATKPGGYTPPNGGWNYCVYPK